MKKLLRGLAWADPSEQVLVQANYQKFDPIRLSYPIPVEQTVLQFCVDFYTAHTVAPSKDTLYEYAEKLVGQPEVLVCVEEILALPFRSGADFEQEFENEVEEQATALFVQTAKDAVKIAREGMLVGKATVKGVDEAQAYLFSNVKGKPQAAGKLPADLAKAEKNIVQLYENRKNNPQTQGITTGYHLVDASTGGIKKQEFYIHAGFGGHLKSTHIMNMIINGAVNGKNMLLFESEMPAKEVMFLMTAIHSGNPKFIKEHPPLSAFRMRHGQLNTKEEVFMFRVLDDLVNNKAHGSIRVIDSSEFTTFGSIQLRTIREHQNREVDFLWIDYLTRLPVDLQYAKMDIDKARNETIADAKRFAMQFDKGRGLSVGTAFQINREGFKRANIHGGKMDATHLSQYNSAEREADIISYIWFGDEQVKINEPLLGIIKSRWGQKQVDPVPLFIDVDSRRIHDLKIGMPLGGIAQAPTVAAGGGTIVELEN